MNFKKSLLTGALALALSANANAVEEFILDDVKINGLQRVALGATLTYVPLQSGDKVNSFRLTQTIKSLFASGHFESIEAYREGNTLIFKVQERPTIAEVILEGNKDLKDEQLQENLDSQDIRAGEPLDKTLLANLEKGLEDFYQSIGKYNADVEAKVTYLPRNRVNLTFEFSEGDAAKVKQINIVGNELFSDDLLLSKFESQQDLAWWEFGSSDRYQKQTLQGDQETLESYYKDRGYIRFAIDSTQVSLTPDKEQVYVTLNVSEGETYTISKVEFVGDLVNQEQAFKRIMGFPKGSLYNAAAVTGGEEAISKMLGNWGYAFPEVETIPEIDDEKKEVALTVKVDPGKRINVRRIIFEGNETTDDEVLRRELRQMESAWLSSYSLEMSKVRIQRLPYVESVEFETVRLPDQDDQVDVIFTVKEQPSGQFNAGIGYGDATGFSMQAGIQHNNFLGTGNMVAFNVNTISYAKTASVSFTDPYFTVDGISLGGSVSYQEIDYGNSFSNTEDYELTRFTSSLNLSYPIDEVNRIRWGVGYFHNEMGNFSQPSEMMRSFNIVYDDKKNDKNQLVFDNYELSTGWSRSTLNKGMFPTAGNSQNLTGKITVPGSDNQYFKLSFEDKHYFPLDRFHSWVFTTRLRLGYANGYGEIGNGNDHVLPTWEYFRAGGQSTMRGFENSVVGPKLFYRTSQTISGPADGQGNVDTIVLDPRFDLLQKYTTNGSQNARSNGGNAQALGTVELIFPLPFVEPAASTSFRTSAFVDFGNVWDTEFDFGKYAELDPDQLAIIDDYSDPMRFRASAGISVQWISPMGPIIFSFAKPLKKFDDDETKFFSFNIGNTF
ncbi:outer membrane protein assembly factor BamA [Saccharobesus litoralis]|uniref:Outer membrane protein assembly factor BamA n=1 Tax=Saccharobesus litoralis TaxID=2172099 RepID=A0A2S0VV92_9ALTE|nr:outer membrane protein assembly factor BamA [Saccharobesus litoralis]AWB68144.1 outer membrane protein assembly factor BamA [Saccharobesus litoralis]